MGLVLLSSDVFAEVDDAKIGGRKLVLTTSNGFGFYDLLGGSQLPTPLDSDLSPVELGTILSWYSNIEDEGLAAEFMDAWDGLTEAGLDLLTVARGLRFGLSKGTFDLEELTRVGRSLTEEVRLARAAVVEKTK